MRELAPGLSVLHGFPPYAVNVYLMGDVLVDAGTRYDRGRILRQLAGRRLAAHALTHAHADHQGSSKAICETLGIPLWCGAGDVGAVESGNMESPGRLGRLVGWLFAGPGHRVSRALREGDDVGGFAVVVSPGHTTGHIAYWREADRVLVLGDVLFNVHALTGRVGLREPPAVFTSRPEVNRRSARKLAALRPALVCFGHGPPLRDEARFAAFVARLAV